MNTILQIGEQTKVTQIVLDISKNFNFAGFDLIFEILEWINSNIKFEKDREIKKQVQRKRTASQIIEDGFAVGCTDYALIFIVLARAKQIHTVYVEGYAKTENKQISGHVIAKCQIGGKWYLVDPSNSNVNLDIKTAGFYKRYKVLAEGLDSWDLGLRSLEDLKRMIDKFALEGRD